MRCVSPPMFMCLNMSLTSLKSHRWCWSGRVIIHIKSDILIILTRSQNDALGLDGEMWRGVATVTIAAELNCGELVSVCGMSLWRAGDYVL